MFSYQLFLKAADLYFKNAKLQFLLKPCGKGFQKDRTGCKTIVQFSRYYCEKNLHRRFQRSIWLFYERFL